mgnify:FL=1
MPVLETREYQGYQVELLTPNPPTGRPYQLVRVSTPTRSRTFRSQGLSDDACAVYVREMEQDADAG